MGRKNMTISGIRDMLVLEAMRHGQPQLATEFSATEIGDIWFHGSKKSAMAVGRKPSGAARAKRIARKRKNIRARGKK